MLCVKKYHLRPGGAEICRQNNLAFNSFEEFDTKVFNIVMDSLKVAKIGLVTAVTVVVTTSGIYVIKKALDQSKFKKAKEEWEATIGQDVVLLHLPLRPPTSGL